MSGFIQQGAVSVTGSGGAPTPKITGVTANNTLICVYQNGGPGTIPAPTDSSGQTWTIRTQVSGTGASTAIAYLLNANSGTHTLTWQTSSSSSGAVISEWNGITGVGGTPPSGTVNNSGATTITTGSYTPSQANEVIIAMGAENGVSSNDAMHCTTSGFQSIGTSTDSASNNCLGIEQDGNSFVVFEVNGQIVTSTAAVSSTYVWTGSSTCSAVICGFAYTPSGGGGNTASIAWVT